MARACPGTGEDRTIEPHPGADPHPRQIGLVQIGIGQLGVIEPRMLSATSTTAATAMATKRSLGTLAPAMVVVCPIQTGPLMNRGSVPQIPSKRATTARARPTVMRTCSMCRS